MRASLDSRSAFCGLVASLVLVGCSGSSEQAVTPPPLLGADAGVSRTVKVDAAVTGGARDSTGVATTGEDTAMDGGVGDGADGVTTEGDGGSAFSGDAAGDGVDGAGDGVDAAPLLPSITVTIDPASLVPPGDGGVSDTLIVPASSGPKPTVSVTVVSNSGDLRSDDVSSVTALLKDPATGTTVASVKPARSETDSAPESNTTRFIFSGVPLDLSKVPTGTYDLVVTATTVGGVSASTKLTLWVDSGPTVVVKSPTAGGYYKGSAPVEVDATQPVFAITLVTMAVGQGDAVPLTQTSQGVYKGTIDFNSFTPPLDGDQLVTFRAYDENGVETDVALHFVSDNTGPSITATEPPIGKMIGSVITISATVHDNAGVDASSVVAVVGNGDRTFEVTLAQKTTGGDFYSNLFDTTKLPSYQLFPTISFRARDVLGNESNVSYELSLDNTPPTIDLNPPMMRMVNNEGQCSWAFDPVGPDAVDDGDLVTQLFDVRVMAEDNGNTPLTGTTDFVPIGGVDQGNVQLLILSNTSRPLVVDTSDPPDGLCDDINPDLVPTTKPQTDTDAQVMNMVPISPHQGADFSPEPNAPCPTGGSSPPEPDSFCGTTINLSKAQYDNSTPPTAHCYAMTEVLSYAGSLPSVYTIGPIVPSDRLQCAGRQFDATNNLKDGWACLAATASDTLGNKQVSRPIRVCVWVNSPASTACPDFKPLTAVVLSDPAEIDTSAPLVGPGGAALQANDEVVVSGVVGVSGINRRWKVTPLDSSGMRFSLQGAHSAGGASVPVKAGHVVPVAAMPDCTGTVIKGGTDGGLPVVDYTKPCKQWADFVPGDLRPY
jgi:hypothetical protein